MAKHTLEQLDIIEKQLVAHGAAGANFESPELKKVRLHHDDARRVQWEKQPSMLNWVRAMASVKPSLRGDAFNHWQAAARFFSTWSTDPAPTPSSVIRKFERERQRVAKAERKNSFREAVEHYGIKCEDTEDQERFDLLIGQIDQEINSCPPACEATAPSVPPDEHGGFHSLMHTHENDDDYTAFKPGHLCGTPGEFVIVSLIRHRGCCCA